jgi:uncharacterized protein YbjT (DUF2867 family)
MNNILITGGTGTLGQAIIKQLAGKAAITVISTRDYADLLEPVNIIKADLTDANSLFSIGGTADIIIHCASNPLNAVAVDIQGTKNLLTSIDRSKLKHFIYISIAGVDKSQFPYYVVKRQVEQLVEDARIPHTILRATQFHEFVLHRMVKPFDTDEGLTVPAGLKFQPIHIDDVAAGVANLITTGPKNEIVTVGGPQILTIEDMAQTYLTISGRPGPLKKEMMQGERFDMLRSGINLCPGSATGRITWADFLTKLYNHQL